MKKTIYPFLLAITIPFFAYMMASCSNETALDRHIEYLKQHHNANCTWQFGFCPEPLCSHHEKPVMLRDYQLELHMDTVRIYDANRLVGSYISNWQSQLDSILLKDNE